MIGCNRKEFQCSREHRVVIEYNKDQSSDRWELVYDGCIPGGGVRQTSMHCGPHTFHEGTVYTAADIQSWTRITIPLPDKVFSRFLVFLVLIKLLRRLLRVDLIKWVSNVRPPVRPFTKCFFDLNEIWYVGRGR